MFKGFDLSGRVAVVIGGTSGIGKAMALGLAEAGADVVATGRRAALVDEVAQEIEARGRRTARLTVDVSSRDLVAEFHAGVTAALGAPDILVNCAGRTKRVPSLEMDEADWAAILETNLTGTLRACQVFGPAMIERRWDRFRQIGSGN